MKHKTELIIPCNVYKKNFKRKKYIRKTERKSTIIYVLWVH